MLLRQILLSLGLSLSLSLSLRLLPAATLLLSLVLLLRRPRLFQDSLGCPRQSPARPTPRIAVQIDIRRPRSQNLLCQVEHLAFQRIGEPGEGEGDVLEVVAHHFEDD
ncbi:hypothetical protein BDZ90DRAFT_665 [Jaminaea rosea]|uniref:Uncharacterized protein n=1 Tax=Jaminaea rosea TaxID=1569628 RepID=A0A316V383_9BASI|nr:hypothetical protein BDZ90DRAFT_665 [Jaminaea rosea]PWN29905.1 hypothetical protein BDZ90DRAFT_665 [Jaminaea rosea]